MESKDELTSNLIILLNRIKTFSCPEYKDVYTKSYFEEVVKPIITNPENTYSFIFGDFNKLGVINDVHGHDFGNRVLEIAFETIKNSTEWGIDCEDKSYGHYVDGVIRMTDNLLDEFNKKDCNMIAD